MKFSSFLWICACSLVGCGGEPGGAGGAPAEIVSSKVETVASTVEPTPVVKKTNPESDFGCGMTGWIELTGHDGEVSLVGVTLPCEPLADLNLGCPAPDFFDYQ